MKPIPATNDSRKIMAETESSSSSCSDRESLMSSEIKEDSVLINVDCKEATETGSSPSALHVEKKNVPKQPGVIKNIIMALKEGKSREITSPSRDYHSKSSCATNQRTRVEASPKRANAETTPVSTKRTPVPSSSKRRVINSLWFSLLCSWSSRVKSLTEIPLCSHRLWKLHQR